MYHKKLAAALAIAVGLTVVGAAPAQAAAQVTIKKIGTKTAPYKSKVKLTPQVKTSGDVFTTSETLTVKKGKKTVAKNKKSVKLKPGKYKVSTTVKYQTITDSTRETVVIPVGGTITNDFSADITLGMCDVTSYRSDTDFDFACDVLGGNHTRVNFTDDDIIAYRAGWDVTKVRSNYIWLSAVRAPVNITRSEVVTTYGPSKTKTRTQSLKVKAGRKPPSCATYNKYLSVYDGMTTSEVYQLLGPSTVAARSGGYSILEYKGCKKYTYFSVSFEYGEVTAKTYVG